MVDPAVYPRKANPKAARELRANQTIDLSDTTGRNPSRPVNTYRSVPLCLSSGADGNLGSVVTAFLVGEHGPPYVGGDASFQAADRFVSGFAFSDLLVEVSPPGTVGHPDLCDCYEMQGRVRLTIGSPRVFWRLSSVERRETCQQKSHQEHRRLVGIRQDEEDQAVRLVFELRKELGATQSTVIRIAD